MKPELFFYDVVSAFNDYYYKDLLTDAHISGDRKSIKLDKETELTVYPLKKDRKLYAIREDVVDKLPILVKTTYRKNHYRDVFDIVTNFSSAKFSPEKHMSFKELVDTLCPFEHENKVDYILWKIIVLASQIHRLAARVCSEPAFGKDSVMKVLGDLTGEVVVVANPTIAKLEYRLTNKSIMLNEFANLKAEDKQAMEHFLLSVGDMSNIYEKHSRASAGTLETYDISKLSVILAYNNLDCYSGGSKYFDTVFSKQTKERFLPLKFKGRMSQQFRLIPESEQLAKEHEETYKKFIRTIAYYKENWVREYSEKKHFSTKEASDYGFENRWARGFDTIVNFIKLYSEDEQEAKVLVKRLFNCHHDYMTMIGVSNSLFNNLPAKEEEDDLEVFEDRVKIQ